MTPNRVLNRETTTAVGRGYMLYSMPAIENWFVWWVDQPVTDPMRRPVRGQGLVASWDHEPTHDEIQLAIVEHRLNNG